MTASKDHNLQSLSLKVRKKKNLSLFFKKFWALFILKLSPLSGQLSNITKFAQLYKILKYYPNLKIKKHLKNKKDIFVKKRLTNFSNIYTFLKNNEFTNIPLFYYWIWKRLINVNFSNEDLSCVGNDKSCYNLNVLINSFINIDYNNHLDNYYNQYFNKILKYWSMYLIDLNDLFSNTVFISRVFHLSINEFSNRLNLLFVFDYLNNQIRTIESDFYTDVNCWDFGNWLVRDTSNSFDILALQKSNISFDLNIKLNQFIKFLVQLLNIREQAIDKHLNLPHYKNNKFSLSNKKFII
jgi:hypothetical protein